MSKKIGFALAALLAAAAAAIAGPASAAVSCDCGTVADAPALLSPDDASSLAATGSASGVSSTTSVDPATALAAASLPGANTSVESDMTPAEAVGMTPSPTLATSSATSTAAAAAQIVCWANAYWARWGTWPYEQKITDTTYWCAQYGVKITYRTSSVTGNGTLCGMNWHTNQLIGGGVGFPSFTMRSSAGFACPTVVPWIVLHPSHHLDVARDDRGGTVLVGTE